MTDGVIHEMSQMLGQLLAGQAALNDKVEIAVRGLNDKIDANHRNAENHWNDFYDKLREVNHATANLAMADLGHTNAINQLSDKVQHLEPMHDSVERIDRRLEAVEVVNARVEGMEARIGSIEQVAWKIGFVVVALWSVLALLATAASHFAVDILKWFRNL